MLDWFPKSALLCRLRTLACLLWRVKNHACRQVFQINSEMRDRLATNAKGFPPSQGFLLATRCVRPRTRNWRPNLRTATACKLIIWSWQESYFYLFSAGQPYNRQNPLSDPAARDVEILPPNNSLASSDAKASDCLNAVARDQENF